MLFVGDQSLIPSPEDWDHPDGGFMFCDHWYACVAGPAGDDIADVFLGRISSCDPAVDSGVVQKVMRYERDANAEWQNQRAILVNHWNPYCRDFTAELASKLGARGVPYDRQNGFDPSVTNQTLKAHIESDGGYGILNYFGIGHAPAGDLWPGWNLHTENFRNEDIGLLTNSSRLSLVYEISCNCRMLTGHVRAWVENASGGGVSAWGATRPCFTNPAKVLDQYLLTIPYDQQMTYACAVMMAAKLRMLEVYPGEEDAIANNRMFHLIGDPSLHVWTADSGALALDYAPREILEDRAVCINAHVGRAASGQPVQNAVVGLHKVNDPLCVKSARTDANGNASLWVYAATPGSITIVASKPLFRCTENRVTVVYPQDAETLGQQSSIVSLPYRFEVTAPAIFSGPAFVQADLPVPTRLGLTVSDVSGRISAKMPSLEMQPGTHTIRLADIGPALQNLGRGTYFVRYECGLGHGLLKFTAVR